MNHIIVALCNLFLLFVIWQYYKDLFEINEKQRNVRWLTGALWYIITFCLSELFHSELINLISSLVLLLLMTIPYYGSVRKKVMVAVMVEALNGACDYLSYLIFNNFLHSDRTYAVSYVGTVIFAYIAEIIIRRVLKCKMDDPEIDGRGVITLVSIPLCMLTVMYCLTQSGAKEEYLVIAIICTLITSFSSFYFYDVVVADRLRNAYEQGLNRQIESYRRELARIESTEIRIEGIRHDLHHHIIEMQDMIKQNKISDVSGYLDQIAGDLNNDMKYSHTGKYEVDSLVNYLMDNAKASLKDVKVKISLPEDINIEKYHLNVILGNLLENAIEASQKSNRQFMGLNIEVRRGMLFIDVSNSYAGDINVIDGRITTTKENGSKHGLGLKNVERIIQKIDGKMNVNYDDEIFKVSVMLYI